MPYPQPKTYMVTAFPRRLVMALAIIIMVFSIAGCASGAPFEKSLYRSGIESWNETKWKYVTRQNLDYSCGASALSTLMTNYFGEPYTEDLVLFAILYDMTKEEKADRAETGFSFLDLARAANLLGYASIGAKLKLKDINKLKGPIIVILKDDTLDHYAILKGMRGDRVYLADSSRGNITVPLFVFAKQWDGRSLIIGKQNFGLPEVHRLAVNPGIGYQPESLMLRATWPALGNNIVR